MLSEDPGRREPMFNAPWPALAVAGIIVAAFGLQLVLLPAKAVDFYAFSPADLKVGRYETLLTAIFLSGGWAHALMNAAAALAFGAPVARLYGLRLEGAVAFILFFVVSGVLANLGFALIHWGGEGVFIGASGAGAALMGAAARIIGGQGTVGPALSGPVVAMGTAWLVVNLMIAVIGFVPGFGGASAAWEVNLVGYAAGVLLVAPFGWLAQRHIFD